MNLQAHHDGLFVQIGDGIMDPIFVEFETEDQAEHFVAGFDMALFLIDPDRDMDEFFDETNAMAMQ